MKRFSILPLILLLACTFSGFCCAADGAPATQELVALCPTTVPAADIHHADRFAEKAAIIAEGNIDLVFLGDSITHFWDVAGTEVQERYFGDLRRVNLGLGWNCTEHVLWELNHIEANKISPRAVMLMIGTNNLGNKKNTPAEIIAGNQAVVSKVRTLWPDAKILVLGVFPRGNSPQNPHRAKISEINRGLENLADQEHVFFLDIGGQFLDENGALPQPISHDYLHLTPDGYEIWAKAVSPTLHGWIAK